MISADKPDGERERRKGWCPSRSLLASIRCYRRSAARGGAIGAVGKQYAVLRRRFWSVVTGADIPLNCRLGGGLLMPHPHGVAWHTTG